MLAEYHLRSGEVEWDISADNETWVGRRIAEDGGRPYEWAMLEYIRDHGPQKGCAVDVGAHIGNHSLYFSLACGLRVEAFEPIFYDDLVTNVELNKKADIEVHPVALGAEEGHARDLGQRVLRVPVAGVGEGRIATGTGPIEVHALDQYNFKDVSLIKIDVEGMEPEVLRGAEATVLRCRPIIYAEAENTRAHKRLEEVLSPWGYKMSLRFKGATPREEWRPSQ